MSSQPKPADLRAAIAESIASNVKAYNVAAFCCGFGLAPQGEGEYPDTSKRVYVQARLQALRLPALLDLAHKVLEEWNDEDLQGLVDGVPGRGVEGELKNLIFASTGPKPQIVLRDALNNATEITRGADTCLVYDRPIPEAGLTWVALVDWWSGQISEENNQNTARRLWLRLHESLGSESEQLLFDAYAARYPENPDVPALIPQVYLHYDPYNRRSREDRPGVVVRQRMDFLMLFPQHRRIVLEVDGQHHYATDGRADPAAYATMVAEDRRLRLAGYEVYRFGGHELMHREPAEQLVTNFFDQLLDVRRPSHL